MSERGWLIERHDDHFAQDTPDEVVLRTVAENGWLFLTQDRKIRSRGPERRILLDHGVGTISVASTANLSAADTINVLIAAEGAIMAAVDQETPPYVIAVYKDGSLRKLDLSDAAEQDAEGLRESRS